jgi:hypothetical protein
MHTVRVLAVLLLVAVTSTTPACQRPAAREPFAGSLVFVVSEHGNSSELQVDVQGQRVRLEVPGSEAAVLIDVEHHDVVTLDPASKRAVRANADNVLDTLASLGKDWFPHDAAPAPAAPPPPPNIKHTGKTDQVAGMTCELWRIEPAHGHIDACVTNALTLPLFDNPLFAWRSQAHVQELPLRTVVFDDDNHESLRIEVGSLERKQFAASHFDVPADYALSDLDAVLKDLKNGTGPVGGFMKSLSQTRWPTPG